MGSGRIDAAPTKLAPNGTIPGRRAVGPRTLQFQAAYGKYDGSFNATSPYLPPTAHLRLHRQAVQGEIKPPTANGTNVTFTCDAARRTCDTTVSPPRRGRSPGRSLRAARRHRRDDADHDGRSSAPSRTSPSPRPTGRDRQHGRPAGRLSIRPVSRRRRSRTRRTPTR